jgi:hypothetical protein
VYDTSAYNVCALLLQAEVEAAAVSGSSSTAVDLPDGSQLHVPLGEEGPFPHPSGDGRQYTVKWAQDDEGKLLVLGCTQLQ